MTLTDATTEELIAELKQRLISEENPRVLRILPFAEIGAEDPDMLAKLISGPEADDGVKGQPAPADKPKRGRPPKAAQPVNAAPALATAPEATTPPTPATTTVNVEATHGVPVKTHTQADVTAALNDHKNVCGLVTTRSLMMEIAGSSRLVDVPAEKYGELVERLEHDTNAAKAGQAAARAKAERGEPIKATAH